MLELIIQYTVVEIASISSDSIAWPNLHDYMYIVTEDCISISQLRSYFISAFQTLKTSKLSTSL